MSAGVSLVNFFGDQAQDEEALRVQGFLVRAKTSCD